jgi:hypothetical protein
MSYTSFEDLAVWKRSARLAVRVYDARGDCRDYGGRSVKGEVLRVKGEDGLYVITSLKLQS